MPRLLCLSVACLLAAMAAPATSVAEDSLAPRHVAVTGTSLARVQPDTVVWSVTVRRTNRDLANAQKECEATVKKVLDLRTELNMAPEDVQTGYLSIEKIFDRDSNGNVTSFKHYQIVRTITLRQRDVTRFDEVYTLLVANTDIEASYSLESSAYHKIRAETRLEAVRAAKEKAAAMTELLGAKLGRVLKIAEPQETSYSPYVNFSNSAYVTPRSAEPDDAAGGFAPGAIEIRVSIDVAFEIE